MNPEETTNAETLPSSSPAECCSELRGTSLVGAWPPGMCGRHFDSVTDWPGVTVAGTAAYWWSELSSHEQPCVAAVRVSCVASGNKSVGGIFFKTSRAATFQSFACVAGRCGCYRCCVTARRLQKNLRHLINPLQDLHLSKLIHRCKTTTTPQIKFQI